METTPPAAAPEAPPDTTASPPPQRVMKECFGVSMGWFMETLIGDYEQRRQCYECPDFTQCQQMMTIKTLVQIRYEIRDASRGLGRAMGGSHSSRPFG